MQSVEPCGEILRREMQVVENWAYFDHAAVAPLTNVAREALVQWADDIAANGDVHWGRWRQKIEQVRRRAAEMIGARQQEVALIRNTTEGINLVAEGFPWKSGDNVVTLAGEFPSNLYPWRLLTERGVEVRTVPTDHERVSADAIASHCDSQTRIVALSWVGYATGWRNELAELAETVHRSGALLFVDAIQGLGVLPIDVEESQIDFLAADGHKWLLGPEGAGVFYMRHEHIDRLRPLGVGWNSVQQTGDFSNTEMRWKQSAARYEGGSYNMAGLLALGANLELFARLGQQQIFETLMARTTDLCEQLRSVGAEVSSDRSENRRSGIVAFRLPGCDPQQVRSHCLEEGVVVNCRGGALRASPHAYTNHDDIGRLLKALNSFRDGRTRNFGSPRRQTGGNGVGSCASITLARRSGERGYWKDEG